MFSLTVGMRVKKARFFTPHAHWNGKAVPFHDACKEVGIVPIAVSLLWMIGTSFPLPQGARVKMNF